MTVPSDDAFLDDWVGAPNIAGEPETYELENAALARDGRLDAALFDVAPWDGRRLVDIGCGTGFWLPLYADRACDVIGVEPDPALLALAERRVHRVGNIEVLAGSAEHLPVDDGSADIVHARFAYFFGSGCERGLAEVRRILAPGGTFIAIDNSWSGGDFARLLRASTGGNADIDPDETNRWWEHQGAERHEITGAWAANSNEELERILRIEFPAPVVEDFIATHPHPTLTYRFALFVWRGA